MQPKPALIRYKEQLDKQVSSFPHLLIPSVLNFPHLLIPSVLNFRAEELFRPVDKDIAVAYRKHLFECYAVKHMEFEVECMSAANFLWQNSVVDVPCPSCSSQTDSMSL